MGRNSLLNVCSLDDKFKADPNKSDRTNDRNRALREERFVEITDAYEVLGDEKKRRVYDKFGPHGLKMLEKGQDPESSYGGYGGWGDAGGFPTFNKEDATKMFQEMVSSNHV
jgi:DnaJ-class molecular chaperone